MKFISGIESTRYARPQAGLAGDILEMTNHHLRFADDFRLARQCGITQLRYPLRMHEIMPCPGQYDWSLTDKMVAAAEEIGIDLIADPMHHASYPFWMADGFCDLHFETVYREFVLAAIKRYPSIRSLTLFNEPMATLWLCFASDIWHPFEVNCPSQFVKMALRMGRMVVELSHEVMALRPDIHLYHIDTCEHYAPANRASEAETEQRNHQRFFIYDLLLGRIGEGHPLFSWLLGHGVNKADLVWFERNRAVLHSIGLDYYRQSEWTVDVETHNEYSRHATGPEKVIRKYAEHLGLPVFLGETNVFGPVRSRISWLKFMVEGAERAELPMFCYYPFLDSVDWRDNLVNYPRGNRDHQGLIELDEDKWERQQTELSYWYTQLALGKATSADLPAYRFNDELNNYLKGVLHLMDHWDWQEA